MKTIEIKNLLKKDLLVVELETHFINSSYHIRETPKGVLLTDDTQEQKFLYNYTLLGKADEISEEEARELVESKPIFGKEYRGMYHIYPKESKLFTASSVLSLLSAIETVVFWENPLDEPSDEIGCECEECQEGFEIKYNDFMIAQEKTFDRARTLIFVKN